MRKNKGALITALAIVVCFMLTGCGSSEDKAVVPFGNTDVLKKTHEEIRGELSEAGFENISEETITTTIDSEVGKVTKLTIDGKGIFTKLTAYEKNVPVVITYKVLQEKEALKEEPEKAETEQETEEEAATIGDVYLMITNAMAMTYGSNYEASYDESGITVNVWEDGTAATAVLAQNGDKEAKETWDNLVKSVTDMTVATKKEIMEKNGYGNKMFAVNVLNDEKKETTLLTIADGVVFYDVVNGIDTTGLEN